MNRTSLARHRLTQLAAAAVSTALAAGIGVRLASYGVPLTLLMGCSLSCLATFTALLFRVVDALSTTLHRCTQPGCDFQVRLTRADAAECRRWQEIAASHPHRAV
ncbi:hypothetical protein ABZ471_40595 [Streptomyces sp. NPDC005728]|uniref:hypothetical protein n=1 Tax=Streptomyces sp. NPDC005728 TaxID=3157054 RepID=UPI0033C3678B